MLDTTSFLNSTKRFCDCDECTELTDDIIKGYVICKPCQEYDIFFEHEGITTTPVDSTEIFTYNENDISKIRDVKYDYKDDISQNDHSNKWC